MRCPSRSSGKAGTEGTLFPLVFLRVSSDFCSVLSFDSEDGRGRFACEVGGRIFEFEDAAGWIDRDKGPKLIVFLGLKLPPNG